MMRFGVHCSLRRGLSGALKEAEELGCEAVQIFTRSPRMWRMRPPADGDVALFRRNRAERGIYPLVVHTPYLPNLATSLPELYRRSLQSLADDLAVAEKIAADFLVIHPGSYSPGSTPETGIANIVRAVNGALSSSGGDTMILFENVAGGGRRLGSSFSEVASMLDGVEDQGRVGVCLDTAHAFGAGYDLSCQRGVDETLEEFERLVGSSRLKVIHCNDSMVPLSSRKDRHQHLGKGHIGTEGFKYFIQRVQDIAAAGILETPKDSPSADRENLSLLFAWRAPQGTKTAPNTCAGSEAS